MTYLLDIPLPNVSVVGHPLEDCYILTHLRMLITRLSIYDALFLLKRMKDSLIKGLLYTKIFLTQLNTTSLIEEEAQPP